MSRRVLPATVLAAALLAAAAAGCTSQEHREQLDEPPTASGHPPQTDAALPGETRAGLAETTGPTETAGQDTAEGTAPAESTEEDADNAAGESPTAPSGAEPAEPPEPAAEDARPGDGPGSESEGPAGERSLADIVDDVGRAVVKVRVEACDGQGLGSGFVVSPRLVATAEHVVSGAVSIEIVRGNTAVAQATVIGRDIDRDLALLRTNTRLGGPTLALSERQPRLAEAVAVIGFPVIDFPEALGRSVTRGIVSNLDQTVEVEGVTRRHLIQTDAAINPGNSGGPLLDAATGDVLGVAVAAGGENLGFAVDSLTAGRLIEAWRASPQPVGAAKCEPAAPPPAPSPPAALRLPAVYEGTFAAVDSLQQCQTDGLTVQCWSTVSGHGVAILFSGEVVFLGTAHAFPYWGGPPMLMGTGFTTPSGYISCDSSGRGVRCRDLTTANGFIIGDRRTIIIRNGQEVATR